MKTKLFCLITILCFFLINVAFADDEQDCLTHTYNNNYPKALRSCNTACKIFRSSKSCNNLGTLYEFGHGVEQSYSIAYNLYQDACDMSNGNSCYNLGRLLHYGLGVVQDQKRAKIYYQQACYLGVSDACFVETSKLSIIFHIALIIVIIAFIAGILVFVWHFSSKPCITIWNFISKIYKKDKDQDQGTISEDNWTFGSYNQTKRNKNNSFNNTDKTKKFSNSFNYANGNTSNDWKDANFSNQEEPIFNIYTEIFALAGYVARGHGQIIKKQIEIVSQSINSISPSDKERNTYKNKFNEGKNNYFLPNSSCHFILNELKKTETKTKVSIIDFTFDLLLSLVFVEKNISQNELSRIRTIASLLDVPNNYVDSRIQDYKKKYEDDDKTRTDNQTVSIYTEIFALAGYVARGHGQITKEQIEIVSKSINSVGATEKEKKTYQNKFNEGKSTNFSPNSSCQYILNELKDSNTKESVINLIFDLMLSLVFFENTISQNELSRITTIASLLDIPNDFFYSMIQNYNNEHKNENKKKHENNKKSEENQKSKKNKKSEDTPKSKNNPKNEDIKENEKPILNLYTEIFALAGYIARGQGKISKEQIKIVSQTIESIAVTENEKTCYQNKFNEGKQDNFNIEPSCSFIYSLFVNASEEEKIAIIVYIFDLFMPIVYADGKLTDEELSRILAVTRLINLPDRLVHSFIYEYENKQNNFQQNERNEVEKAFTTLGLGINATFEEVKKAYKRLIKNYHPDRVKILNIPENQKEKVMKDYTQKAQEINKAYSILKKHFEN